MDSKPIRTDADCREALEGMESLMPTDADSPEGKGPICW